MRASRALRLFIGAFNTVAAAAIAAYGTAVPVPSLRSEDLTLHLGTAWGAVVAAAIATLSIALGLALVGWAAIGYLLWLALFAGHAFSLVFLALAISLAPVVPRPGGSVWQGLAVAAATTVLLVLLVPALL